MERRSFIKHTGLAGILAAGSAPAFAQAAPEVKWRCASSFPKSLDTIFGAAETISEARRRVDRTTSSRSRCSPAGEIVPGLRRRRRRAERHGPVRPHGAVLLLRQGSDVRVRHRHSVRPEPAAAERVVVPRRRHAADATSSSRTTTSSTSRRATPARRWAAGSARRSRRVADLKGLKMRIGGIRAARCCRSSASCRSRSPAATSIRRSRRARSTPPSGSARTTTRSSASTRSPSSTTTRAGGKAARRCDLFVNTKAYDELPKDYQAILEARVLRSERRHDGEVRRAEPGRAASGWSAAACKLRPFSNDDHGRLLQGGDGGLRGNRGQEREVQEGLRTVEGVPERPDLVVPASPRTASTTS